MGAKPSTAPAHAQVCFVDSNFRKQTGESPPPDETTPQGRRPLRPPQRTSNVGLLRQRERVVRLNAEVAHRALQLGMPE